MSSLPRWEAILRTTQVWREKTHPTTEAGRCGAEPPPPIRDLAQATAGLRVSHLDTDEPESSPLRTRHPRSASLTKLIEM